MLKQMKTLTATCMLVTSLLLITGFQTKSAENSGKVTVQQGETPEKIASRYGSTAESPKKANRLDSTQMKLGQELNIVFPYKVTDGEQIEFVAKKYKTSVQAIQALNGLSHDKLQQNQNIPIPVTTRYVTTNSDKLQEEAKEERIAKAKKKEKQPVAKKATDTLDKTKSSKASTSNSIAGYEIKETINMRATAYGVAGNEQWGTLTASGTQSRAGVVAVDPSVIPLGSKVYVSGYDSPYLPKGGFVGIAEDTGGAIKDKRIDIFIDLPESKISLFGVQDVKVQVLK